MTRVLVMHALSLKQPTPALSGTALLLLLPLLHHVLKV
jgi:hypothetical protein